MSQHDLTASEMYESLNGYDELACAKTFGEPISAFAETDPMRFARALIYVAERRKDGVTDSQAKQAAFSMTNGETMTYFADEPEDLDPEEPDSDEGKGD